MASLREGERKRRDVRSRGLLGPLETKPGTVPPCLAPNNLGRQTVRPAGSDWCTRRVRRGVRRLVMKPVAPSSVWSTRPQRRSPGSPLPRRFQPAHTTGSSSTSAQDACELHGVVPGSVHIPRSVLEWRIALDSPWRNRHLRGLDQRLILICDHGYSSILAASNLVQLGFYRAGDVIGGFESWRDSGLPIAPCRPRLSAVGALPGSGPPE